METKVSCSYFYISLFFLLYLFFVVYSRSQNIQKSSRKSRSHLARLSPNPVPLIFLIKVSAVSESLSYMPAPPQHLLTKENGEKIVEKQTNNYSLTIRIQWIRSSVLGDRNWKIRRVSAYGSRLAHRSAYASFSGCGWKCCSRLVHK